MYYDTHCHPYLAQEKTQEEILENFFAGWGQYLNSIGCDIPSSQASIDLAIKHTWVRASIWIHPTHASEYSGALEETIERLRALYHANPESVVAIGEIGLDYHWLESLSQQHNISQEEIIKTQKKFFKAQIQLAKELNLPIIIHNRSSAEDLLEILMQEDCTNFVFHCYSEDLSYALRLMSFAPDCMIGFGWVTTFKSALGVQEAAQGIPLKNIIIETDSPYLTPTPYRGKQENEPILVKYILSKIIDLRDESPEEITTEIYKNSLKFFGIKK